MPSYMNGLSDGAVWMEFRLFCALTASESSCGCDAGALSRCPRAVAMAWGKLRRTILVVRWLNWEGPVMNPAETACKKVRGREAQSGMNEAHILGISPRFEDVES